MKFDVSDIKSFRSCQRQWQLTSRNQFHLRPRATPPQLIFGTIFHEALHGLYMGRTIESVMEEVKKEMNPGTDIALLAMIPGYAKEVLPGDLDRFQILDIEHKFKIPAQQVLDFYGIGYSNPDIAQIELVGSVDMVAVDRETFKVYFFEHKTCKDFREDSYLWMDEQPRLYYARLEMLVDELNYRRLQDWQKICEESDGPLPEAPRLYTPGGVYLNEVKKLLKQFKYKRTLCEYPYEDMCNFLQAFVGYCIEEYRVVNSGSFCCPHPDYFKCKMCSFSDVCATYMYQDIDKAQLLQEFSESLMERETDHLDEKVERRNDDEH